MAPDPYYHAFDPDTLQIPGGVIETIYKVDWSHEMYARFGPAGVREFLRIYYAQLIYIDDQVGRLLEALDATGEARNTVVVFTADHGDMMGAHEMLWKSTISFYRQIVDIPLIVRYPAKIHSGICDAQVNGVDLMPTFLELAGVAVPAGIEGRSLVPLLTGKMTTGINLGG